jgi:hypothetical protein
MSMTLTTKTKELVTLGVAILTSFAYMYLLTKGASIANWYLIYFSLVFGLLSMYLSDKGAIFLRPAQLYAQIKARKIAMGRLEKFYRLMSLALLVAGVWARCSM